MTRIGQTLERYAPGFGELVRGRHVAGPAELAAENRSLVRAVYGSLDPA